MYPLADLPVGYVDVIKDPGAAISTVAIPRLEKDEIAPLDVVLATETMLGQSYVAG